MCYLAVSSKQSFPSLKWKLDIYGRSSPRLAGKHFKSHFKLVRCPYCPRKAAEQSEMRRHFEETYGREPGVKKGKCSIEGCDATFARNKESFKRHVKAVHGNSAHKEWLGENSET